MVSRMGAAAVGCGVLLLVAGCGFGNSARQQADTASPGGDIPDSQAYVEYMPPSGLFSVKAPEGWARTEQNGTATFADKLNLVQVSTVSSPSAPTVESARAQELPSIQASVRGFRSASVTSVTRAAGPAVLVAYEADSTPDPVTGKVVRDSVQRYEFWRGGTEAVLVLASPTGADNADPWRTIADSFRWR
ncbi:MAG TPA: hypothetical protein VGO86_09570 [Candidatus Dormibacteraeota bacterium]